MVSVNTALALVNQHTLVLQPKKLPLELALGYFLAEDIFAPISIPPFRQSAMDGYAITYGQSDAYEVVGESKAGDFQEFDLAGNRAVRILTGARVPDLADTVVIQENICRTGSEIRIQQMPKPFANVRCVGEQVKAGELIARKGAKIQAMLLGFLAGFGIAEVLVINKPKINVLVTGNELQAAGTSLGPGGVYETSGVTIKAILAEQGFRIERVDHVRDDKLDTALAIKEALDADVLLISGGISVGDYDFVKAGLEMNGVQELFHQVNQKPARPMWFGKKGKTLVFALPGNPAAMVTCMQVYVLPALRKMTSAKACDMSLRKGTLAGELSNPSGKSLFLLANEQNGNVKILDKQSCNALGSYAQANALVYVDESVSRLEYGDAVNFLPINNS
ncbi:gephyrin-like molybdotransferase Glp [Algoriphagus terrigena]|uniref:molybdopterin molybdotransferase MoeA n=1 Tax=Algoriphagus terrigena TaxID=344884 RepID=UPI0004793984|nr:gephyrin-like molybdotransferase Glp [Algoriphagus terrigena]